MMPLVVGVLSAVVAALFIAILAILLLALLARNRFCSENDTAMPLLYAWGVGRLFPWTVAGMVARLRVLGGRVYGQPRSFVIERITGYNTLHFETSLRVIDRMLTEGATRYFFEESVPSVVLQGNIVLLWHTYDYLYHVNDLLHATQGDVRPVLIMRRYVDPEFHDIVTRLCRAYGREVIFVLERKDLMTARNVTGFDNAVWLIGAEFLFRQSSASSRYLHRKVFRSASICVHTPWPDGPYNWQDCQDFVATAQDHLSRAKKFYGKAMIWPQGLSIDSIPDETDTAG
jgi:hypothetical protein